MSKTILSLGRLSVTVIGVTTTATTRVQWFKAVRVDTLQLADFVPLILIIQLWRTFHGRIVIIV